MSVSESPCSSPTNCSKASPLFTDNGSSITDNGSRLTGTAVHPFYVINKDAWIEMGSLEKGDQLLLHNGQTAIVEELSFEEAPEDQTFTTYNFEVDDFHTYFVAPKNSPPNTEFVWVHNDGKDGCGPIADAAKQTLQFADARAISSKGYKFQWRRLNHMYISHFIRTK